MFGPWAFTEFIGASFLKICGTWSFNMTSWILSLWNLSLLVIFESISFMISQKYCRSQFENCTKNGKKKMQQKNLVTVYWKDPSDERRPCYGLVAWSTENKKQGMLWYMNVLCISERNYICSRLLCFLEQLILNLIIVGDNELRN